MEKHEYLTTVQAQSVLQCSHMTLRKYVENGWLEKFYEENGCRCLYKAAEVNALKARLDAKKSAPVPA